MGCKEHKGNAGRGGSWFRQMPCVLTGGKSGHLFLPMCAVIEPTYQTQTNTYKHGPGEGEQPYCSVPNCVCFGSYLYIYRERSIEIYMHHTPQALGQGSGIKDGWTQKKSLSLGWWCEQTTVKRFLCLSLNTRRSVRKYLSVSSNTALWLNVLSQNAVEVIIGKTAWYFKTFPLVLRFFDDESSFGCYLLRVRSNRYIPSCNLFTKVLVWDTDLVYNFFFAFSLFNFTRPWLLTNWSVYRVSAYECVHRVLCVCVCVCMCVPMYNS